MLYCVICHKEKQFEFLPNFHFENDKVIFDIQCECGGEMVAGFYGGNSTGQKAGTHSYYSKALGVHPSQIKGEMERHPSWRFRGDGALEVRGYADQRNKVKELGMVDLNDAKD